MDTSTEPVVTAPTAAEARFLLPQLLHNLSPNERSEKLRWLLPALETLPNPLPHSTPTPTDLAPRHWPVPLPASPESTPVSQSTDVSELSHRSKLSKTSEFVTGSEWATGSELATGSDSATGSELATARQFLSGLFVARVSATANPAAVVWVHPAPGATALVAAPLAVKPGATFQVCGATPVDAVWQTRLLQQAVRWAEHQGVEMLQAVAQPEDHVFQAALTQAGIAPLVDLVFVASPPLQGPPSNTGPMRTDCDLGGPSPTVDPPRAKPVAFHCLPPTNEHLERWYRLLEATYVDSLDCPAINGRRSLAHTVAGYQATGQRWDPGWMVLTSDGGADVGGFILADHPAEDFLELIYFGVVPPARGCGLGRRILEQALSLAAQAGRSRLIAAVDRRNLPALRVYAAADFSALEQRAVFARFFTPKSSSSDTGPKIR